MSSSSFQFTPSGPVAPETAGVLAAVQRTWQAAFDNQLNLDPTTPQGQLIASLTAIIQEKNAQLLFMANQLNPDVAEGIWQDALGRIYFLDRKPALPTVTQCLCVGLEGTLIPGLDASTAPALVADATGNAYACQTSGRIGYDGTVTLPFAAQRTGPLVCPANTLKTIVRAIPGWDTVSNPEPGATGQDVESRASFEARRRASVALNGNGSTRAIYANVANVPNVIDCIVRENVSDIPILIGAVSLAPHSVYVSVVGGDDDEIARAIAERKSAGSAMNGNTSAIVTDKATGAQQTIRWERPETVRFGVLVELILTSATPADIAERVRSAVLAAFHGTDGGERVRLGATAYASRFYAGAIGAGVTDLVRVRVAAPFTGQESAAWAESVTLEINQFPALAAADIRVSAVEK